MSNIVSKFKIENTVIDVRDNSKYNSILMTEPNRRYVNSSTGLDTNPGTPSQPYKTIMRALEDLNKGCNDLRVYLMNVDTFTVDKPVFTNCTIHFVTMVSGARISFYNSNYNTSFYNCRVSFLFNSNITVRDGMHFYIDLPDKPAVATSPDDAEVYFENSVVSFYPGTYVTGTYFGVYGGYCNCIRSTIGSRIKTSASTLYLEDINFINRANDVNVIRAWYGSEVIMRGSNTFASLDAPGTTTVSTAISLSYSTLRLGATIGPELSNKYYRFIHAVESDIVSTDARLNASSTNVASEGSLYENTLVGATWHE